MKACIGRSTMPDTRRDAKKAVRLIFENLGTAYDDGQNIEARKNVLEAYGDAIYPVPVLMDAEELEIFMTFPIILSLCQILRISVKQMHHKL